MRLIDERELFRYPIMEEVMRTVFCFLCSLMVLSVIITDQADASSWELLGERKVNMKTDRDVIYVTRSDGLFNRLKFSVHHRGIEILDVKVYFSNGAVHDIAVRKYIEAGGETRTLDLPGAARSIKKIEFVYRSRGRLPGRATVRVWGHHAKVAEEIADTADTTDWELIGERLVDHGLDHDIIPVTIAEGTFGKIKLIVRNRKIEFLDLKIHFGNGDVQDVAVRRIIPAGGETRIIDLEGNDRVIKKVTFWYRTSGKAPGRATVRLWGKH